MVHEQGLSSLPGPPACPLTGPGPPCMLPARTQPPAVPHTCEADGAFEGAAHALEAVLNEMAEQLGRGVEHLVAQLTLVVDAFLCKEPQESATQHAWSLQQPTPCTPRPAHPDPQNQGWWGTTDAETHPSPRGSSHPQAYRTQGAGPLELALEGVLVCDLSCWSRDPRTAVSHGEAPGWGLHGGGGPAWTLKNPTEG